MSDKCSSQESWTFTWLELMFPAVRRIGGYAFLKLFIRWVSCLSFFIFCSALRKNETNIWMFFVWVSWRALSYFFIFSLYCFTTKVSISSCFNLVSWNTFEVLRFFTLFYLIHENTYMNSTFKFVLANLLIRILLHLKIFKRFFLNFSFRKEHCSLKKLYIDKKVKL